MPTLPANKRRAQSALRVASGYSMTDEARNLGLKSHDLEADITDLLTDLRHLCQYKSIDFDRKVSQSDYHYTAELKGEE